MSSLDYFLYDITIMQFWLLTVTKLAKSRPSKMLYIFIRSTCICLIVVLTIRAVVGVFMRSISYIQIDVPIGNVSPKITKKLHFSSKIGKSGNFSQKSENSFQMIYNLSNVLPDKILSLYIRF